MIRESRRFEQSLTIETYSHCSSFRGVASRSSSMPSMPFMGVRISWLMVARKSLLARLARSASSLALARSEVLSRTMFSRFLLYSSSLFKASHLSPSSFISSAFLPCISSESFSTVAKEREKRMDRTQHWKKIKTNTPKSPM